MYVAMSWRMGQLRWQGVIGTLKPRSRCPLMIFIGALSMTFLAIAPSTCAALTMPTGALRREKIPPSGAVTIAASACDRRITSAPRSMRSPRSISGAGRITSRTLVCSSRSNEATTASRPIVPSTSSPRTTTSGTGSWRRSTSRTSDSVSSGSHSAPSGEAMLPSSGMDGLATCEREVSELARGHHAHHGLIFVGDDRKPAFVMCHERDNLAQALMLVNEQWRRAQHVARLHVRRRRTHREIAAGDNDISRDEMVDDVLLGDVADRPAGDEHDDLTQDVVSEQLGDGVRRRAREAEHHLISHHRSHLRVTRLRRQAVRVEGGR